MNPAKETNVLLEIVATEIDISRTMMDLAVDSYNAVGTFLGNNLEDYDLHIMPQGSFNLGTVIKPLTDKDEYDIDLVCLLEDGQALAEKDIKVLTGKPLKESKRYAHVEEGRRCWKLQYDNFHMDILPCVPLNTFILPDETDIRLTHKEDNGDYSPSYSNPYQYQRWFESRMEMPLRAARMLVAEAKMIEIDQVPTYQVRTPLQKAVQLLKRHRDIMFEGKEDAPISIIITTLASHAYTGQDNLYDALEQILDNMGRYIEYDSGKYIISNPTILEENFAEKWNESPQKARNFMGWLRQAKSDFSANSFLGIGFEEVQQKMSFMFGENVAIRSLNEYGIQMKNAREKSELNITQVSPTLTRSSDKNTMQVKDHTFYGSL